MPETRRLEVYSALEVSLIFGEERYKGEVYVVIDKNTLDPNERVFVYESIEDIARYSADVIKDAYDNPEKLLETPEVALAKISYEGPEGIIAHHVAREGDLPERIRLLDLYRFDNDTRENFRQSLVSVLQLQVKS